MIYSLSDIPDVVDSFIRREYFHLIIRGDIQTGKSTYVNKLLSEYSFLEPYGYYTKKCVGEKGIINGLYIHSANVKENDRFYSEQNRIAPIIKDCSYGDINTNVFETVGRGLLTPRCVKQNNVAIADEVGFLERNAHEFLTTLQNLFYSNNSIIAVFKNRSISYLDEMLKIPGSMVIDTLPGYKFKISYS